MDLKPGKLAEVRSVLTNRSFAVYTSCNSISMVGVWMQKLAVGWLTWQLTGSGFWIGAIVFADLIPVVLIGPLAGVRSTSGVHSQPARVARYRRAIPRNR